MATHPRQIRALVVDDEAPARKRIGELLARDADIGTVFTAENGVAAITEIHMQEVAGATQGAKAFVVHAADEMLLPVVDAPYRGRDPIFVG